MVRAFSFLSTPPGETGAALLQYVLLRQLTYNFFTSSSSCDGEEPTELLPIDNDFSPVLRIVGRLSCNHTPPFSKTFFSCDFFFLFFSFDTVMECQSDPRSTGDADGRESSSPVLRSLIDGMPTLAFGTVLTVVLPRIATESDRMVIKNASAASDHFIHMDVFAFSMVGTFASALSSITFRRSRPEMAHVLEDVPVVFLGSAFASLVSVLIHERFRWFAYVLCMIPVIPLLRRPLQSLSGCLAALVRILAAPVAAWFDGGEASGADGSCGSVEGSAPRPCVFPAANFRTCA